MPIRKRRRRPPAQPASPPSTALTRIPPTTYERDDEDEVLESLNPVQVVSGGSLIAVLTIRADWRIVARRKS